MTPSLRLRVAVLAAVVTGCIVAIGGSALVEVVEREAREDLDQRLEEDLEDASTRASVRVILQNLRDEDFDPTTSSVGFFFTGRVFAKGELLGQSEDVPDLVRRPSTPGFSTIGDTEGQTWRVLVEEADVLVENLEREGPFTIQVMLPTAETEATIADVRATALRLGLIAISAAAALGWLLGWSALRPMRRLADEASSVSATEDLARRVPAQGPRETRIVAESLNGMLARLEAASKDREAALETARAFAADVGHELRAPLTAMATDLDVLRRNPDLEASERDEVVDELAGQHDRIVRLLDELRLLARADLREGPGDDLVDIVAIVENCVEQARRTHPQVRWTTDLTEEDVERTGSAEGLRIMITNLLDNAAIHGAGIHEGEARVAVSARANSTEIVVEVTDDGPGIVGGEELFDRFHRGDTAGGSGSGLGLAIVRQQAERHGGSVVLARISEEGGTRAVLRLPIDTAV